MVSLSLVITDIQTATRTDTTLQNGVQGATLISQQDLLQWTVPSEKNSVGPETTLSERSEVQQQTHVQRWLVYGQDE